MCMMCDDEKSYAAFFPARRSITAMDADGKATLTDAGLARWLFAVYALNPPSIIELRTLALP